MTVTEDGPYRDSSHGEWHMPAPAVARPLDLCWHRLVLHLLRRTSQSCQVRQFWQYWLDDVANDGEGSGVYITLVPWTPCLSLPGAARGSNAAVYYTGPLVPNAAPRGVPFLQ